MPAPVPEAQPDAKPWIVIRKNQSDPPLVESVAWDVQTSLIKPFEVKLETGNVVGTIRHYWYFDMPAKAQPLDSYAVCGPTAKCSLQLCAKLANNLPDHDLLAVVSDRPLNPEPKGPYDFPPGTAFDSVLWHIKKVGNCP